MTKIITLFENHNTGIGNLLSR